MPVLLILIVATIAELAVLIGVGRAIGVLPTIGLLILTTLVGILLLRREGTRALLAFREAMRTRRPPARELVDGVLIAAAGILIVLPGFISDVFGLLLLLPPTRALLRRRMLHAAVPGPFRPGSFTLGTFPGRFSPSAQPGGAQPGPAPAPNTRRVAPGEVMDGDVIEGEIVDEPPRHRPGTDPR